MTAKQILKLAVGHKVIVNSLIIGQTGLCQCQLAVAELQLGCRADFKPLLDDVMGHFGLLDTLAA